MECVLWFRKLHTEYEATGIAVCIYIPDRLFEKDILSGKPVFLCQTTTPSTSPLFN